MAQAMDEIAEPGPSDERGGEHASGGAAIWLNNPQCSRRGKDRRSGDAERHDQRDQTRIRSAG